MRPSQQWSLTRQGPPRGEESPQVDGTGNEASGRRQRAEVPSSLLLCPGPKYIRQSQGGGTALKNKCLVLFQGAKAMACHRRRAAQDRRDPKHLRTAMPHLRRRRRLGGWTKVGSRVVLRGTRPFFGGRAGGRPRGGVCAIRHLLVEARRFLIRKSW